MNAKTTAGSDRSAKPRPNTSAVAEIRLIAANYKDPKYREGCHCCYASKPTPSTSSLLRCEVLRTNVLKLGICDRFSRERQQ